MNKRIKKLWIDALNSGKYPQGRRQLKDEGKYCCLGVLQNIYLKEKGEKWTDSLKNQASPDSIVCKWAKIDENEIDQFWSLNDTENLTFPEIAIYIENSF